MKIPKPIDKPCSFEYNIVQKASLCLCVEAQQAGFTQWKKLVVSFYRLHQIS